MANPNPSPATRFKPGQTGNPHGARKKLLSRVDEKLSEAGFHPVSELLKLYPSQPDVTKVKICFELLAYVAAKPRDEIPTDDELKALELRQLTRPAILELIQRELQKEQQGETKEAG